MYKIGDRVMYGNTGVCMIEDVTTRDIPGTEKDRLYYVLRPLYKDCVIYTPTDNEKVFMRPVISKEAAESLIEEIPQISAEAYHNRVLRELSEHYEAKLNTHDCSELIRMTMSIYAKKQYMVQQKKKFGAVDDRFMKRAEDMLFGELATALGIPRDDVTEYIRSMITKASKSSA